MTVPGRIPIRGLQELLPSTRAGDETHILAVRLGCCSQAEIGCQQTHVGLRELADRKAHPSELGLVEHVQHVALVLGRVQPPSQRPAAVRTERHPGMVPRGDGIEAELVGPGQQTIELEMPIAFDARIRSTARGMVGHVRLDHVLGELLGEGP